jgi:hypothetical protein
MASSNKFGSNVIAVDGEHWKHRSKAYRKSTASKHRQATKKQISAQLDD